MIDVRSSPRSTGGPVRVAVLIGAEPRIEVVTLAARLAAATIRQRMAPTVARRDSLALQAARC